MAKKSLTILQVLPALERGGVERGTVQVDNALVAAGHKSIVVSNGGKLVAELKGSHLQLPMHTKNPIKILFNAHVLKYIIKENDIDIVHARSRAPAWSALIAARATKTKFVTTFHGTYGAKNRLKRWYNSVMTKGDGVIAVSEFIKKHIMDIYGDRYDVAAEKIDVIHRGVDVEAFDPDVEPAKMGLPKGKKVVLLPGRITRWKGQKEFALAMKEIDATGLIVGEVESDNYMKELEEILPDNVIVMPPSGNMPEVYAVADVVVTASNRPEAFGRIAIEAQAMGRPIVATAHGGSMETVLDGKTGALVEPGNVESLREGIQKVLPKTDSMKKACIENSKNFSQKKFVEKELAHYLNVFSSEA